MGSTRQIFSQDRPPSRAPGRRLDSRLGDTDARFIWLPKQIEDIWTIWKSANNLHHQNHHQIMDIQTRVSDEIFRIFVSCNFPWILYIRSCLLWSLKKNCFLLSRSQELSSNDLWRWSTSLKNIINQTTQSSQTILSYQPDKRDNQAVILYFLFLKYRS